MENIESATDNAWFTTVAFNMTYNILQPNENNASYLVLYTLLTAIGTMFNIFQISALIIQEELRHCQNAFIANHALSNMIVTSFVFPSICISILSGIYNTPELCYLRWYCTLLTFLTSTLNYFAISLNVFLYSMQSVTNTMHFCNKKLVIIGILLVWFISGGCLTALIAKQGPDICERKVEDNTMYLLILIPLVISVILFVLSLCYLRSNYNQSLTNNTQSLQKRRVNTEVIISNFVAFLLFLCLWLPLLLTLILSTPHTVQSTTIKRLLTLAEMYSCLCALCYAFTSRSFKDAFIYNIRYFCFKSRSSIKTAQMKPQGSVRVHIGMETRVNSDRSHKASKALSAILPSDANRRKSDFDYL